MDAAINPHTRNEMTPLAWWKYTATAAVSVAITLIITQVTLRGELETKVDKTEAIKLIQQNSPYIEDRRSLNESAKSTNEAVQELARQNTALVTKVEVLASRIDLLLRSMQKTREQFE